MTPMRFLKPVKNEKGQGLVEYAVILLLVAAAAVGVFTTFGGGVVSLYSTIVSSWP